MPMTCAVHSDQEAVAYCRNCGRAMCPDCKRDVRGMIYCEDCLVERVQAPAAPAAAPAPSYSAAPHTRDAPSPGLALFLGLIPGVGAIYNGQFAKAFLHVVLFGLLVTVAHNPDVRPFNGVFVALSIFFIPYMAGEAYHTARKRQSGQPVDEWSGLLPAGSRLQGSAGALFLIVVGVVFLLDNLNIVPLGQLLRYWPVVLIVAGVLMLYQKLAGRPEEGDRGGFSGPR